MFICCILITLTKVMYDYCISYRTAHRAMSMNLNAACIIQFIIQLAYQVRCITLLSFLFTLTFNFIFGSFRATLHYPFLSFHSCLSVHCCTSMCTFLSIRSCSLAPDCFFPYILFPPHSALVGCRMYLFLIYAQLTSLSQ